MPVTLTQLDNGVVEVTGVGTPYVVPANVRPRQTASGITLRNDKDVAVFNFPSVSIDATNGVDTVVESTGTSHTITTPSTLYEAAKLVFNDGGGSGSGAAFFVPNSATLPFADVAARNTWAAANLSDLIQNQTVVEVTGAPDNTWYLWRGTSNPASHDPLLWIDATPLIRGPQGPTGAAGSDGAPGATGPAGADGADGTFTDRDITANLTLNVANLSTYNRSNIINTETTNAVTVTLDTIANFLAGMEGNVVFRFINPAGSSTFTITAGGSDVLGRLGSSISILAGNSLTIKLPTAGVRWIVVASPTTAGAGGIVPPPVTPQPTPDGDVILQPENSWLAEGGTFPSGSQAGYLYVNDGEDATIDSQDVPEGAVIIARVDNASTTSFDDWQFIENPGVHSCGGLSGIIDDRGITTVLSRLGFTTGGSQLSALSDFVLNDIPSRIDTTTSLVGDHSITFNITNPEQFTDLTVQMNNTAIHTINVAGLQAGTNTITDVNISAAEWLVITSGNITVIPFQLSGTTNSGVIKSNTVTVSRRNLQDHEFFYYGRAAQAALPETIDINTLTSIELGSVAGQTETFTIPTGSDNDKIILLAPADRDITSLINTSTNFPVLSTFTKVDNDRIINSENFDSYELDALRAAFTATYRVIL